MSMSQYIKPLVIVKELSFHTGIKLFIQIIFLNKYIDSYVLIWYVLNT